MALDLSEAKIRRNEFGLWLGWTAATTAGMLLGLLPFLLLIDFIDLLWLRILVPITAGFLVGLFQWLVLRPYLVSSLDWILNGGAGWSLGYILGLMLIQWLNQTWIGVLIGYLLFGLIIGLLQWPVLSREIPSALTWVGASVLGWALGSFGGQFILNLFVTSDVISQTLSSTVISGVTGLVAGAVTGLALVWIARRPDVPQTTETPYTPDVPQTPEGRS